MALHYVDLNILHYVRGNMRTDKKESRTKKYIRNTTYRMVYFVLSMLIGFILPRMYLKFYGSTINGLISSVTQFLSLITFADMGVGSVTLASYYKPLAEEDSKSISNIYAASRKFYNNVGKIFGVYMFVILVYFVFFHGNNIGRFTTGMLVVALSITSFAQYFFGMANGILLKADQREYYTTKINTITLVVNAIACILLMYLGFGIHWVKLSTALIFLVRPLYLKYIVRKLYTIDYNACIDGDPIQQKWNGMAQHIASVVNTNTDVTVLTVLGNLGLVSVYSVHYLVTEGIWKLFMVVYQGMLPTFGNIVSVETDQTTNRIFDTVEWFTHTAITLLYVCTGILITPFILLYTKGVTDVNYNTPLFATLLVLSQALFCMKTPYQYMYQAAGHFKQTQMSYLVEAGINIVISCVMVFHFGLVGVAVGTLIAAAYRMIYLVWYLSKNIIHRPVSKFLKFAAIDLLQMVLMIVAAKLFPYPTISLVGWIIYAIEIFCVCTIISVLINIVFYKDQILIMKKRFLKTISKI